MTSHESLSHQPAVLRLSEIDFSLFSPGQAQAYLIAAAEQHGLDPQDALFTGFDALDFDMDGTFGSRTETWAFTLPELQDSSTAAERYGDYDTNSPFYYARLTHPAGIAIFDRQKFDNLGFQQDGDEVRQTAEYRLKDGVSMDEAAVAVMIIE